MNRKEAAELLPFIKAFGEGKDIEIRSKNTHAQLNGLARSKKQFKTKGRKLGKEEL